MNNERIAKLRAQGKSLREISSVAGLSHEAIRKRLKLVSTSRSVLSTPGDPLKSRESAATVKPSIDASTPLRIEHLIPERILRERLSLPKEILATLRKKGLPFLDLEGKIYFHEQIFVQWVLDNSLKIREAIKRTANDFDEEEEL